MTASIQHLFNHESFANMSPDAILETIFVDAFSQPLRILANAYGRVSVSGGPQLCYGLCAGITVELGTGGSIYIETTAGGAGVGVEPAGSLNFEVATIGDSLPSNKVYVLNVVDAYFLLGGSLTSRYWSGDGLQFSQHEFEIKVGPGAALSSKPGVGVRR